MSKIVRKGSQRLDDRILGTFAADGRHVSTSGRDAVGHQQIGLEGQLRQARAHRRRRAEAAHRISPSPRKDFGDRDGADSRRVLDSAALMSSCVRGSW